ncbi:nck-associated protein 5 [Sorex araneus]|uniref:nck-associated protein 5 n=1 Tax=Sorex araneus TaxID=42254 RepID=UPI0024338664|nr:nck-associated protein 5 [Sorex araneus]
MEEKRQLEKRDFGKRLSLDSSLVEHMDSNKYIEHLLTQLEEQNKSLWREKLAVARLQRKVAQRENEEAIHEKLIHDLEEERHLRLQSEKRLQEMTLESECNRIQMRGLQQQFSRMEETVRNLLQIQGRPEQKKEETVNIMVYQEKPSEEERKHKEVLEDLHMVVDENSRSESSSTEEGKEKTKLLLERLKALEAENSALALENESQREEYERCLDEVANQVVQALLTQKDLREECVKLKTRVFDLEQQNRTLSILFQQRVRPTSDLLFQKLHSRILDLSSGDLLSEAERGSLTRSRTDVRMHECQLNTKLGAPALRCHGLGVVIPGHLCPRNSCSSSDLSLSSTCSEYSSGSSNTWHDSKSLRKRQSSHNWDKRLSIDSSLPSGFASPTDELPPTRIKESHILEGLRKLQKRRVFLEPPSVITKWGYKDCMNSNEGIYSPGIKSSSLQEYPAPTPAGTGPPCWQAHKTFVYDTDSHDDAEEDAFSLANQTFRPHGCKLTHSVSDSLFAWELNGKYFSDGIPSVYCRERPEKLTSCTNNHPWEKQLCPTHQETQSEREWGLDSQGHVTLNPQLSDTDDNETLDELHIGSSDEKSPSDLSLAADTDKSTENLDTLVELGKSQAGSPAEEEKPMTIQCDSRPKTFSFIKQQKVVRRTSSEECITVIFDAEDGEPIEFSSHQTGIVTVTRNEISVNQAPTGPKAEHTELLPQGIAHSQPEAATRDYAFLKRTEEEKEKNIPKDDVDNVAATSPDSFSSRTAVQSVQRQNLTEPTHHGSCQNNSRSLVATGLCQKQITKIPARGKTSPQKSKIMEPDATTRIPSSVPVTLEKSPPLTPGKLSRFKKMESLTPLFDLRSDSHIPKHPAQPPHDSKMPSRKDWSQHSKSQIPASQLLSRSLNEPSEDGEPPTRDKHCDPEPEAGLNSSVPPPPPGRSVSLLIKPNYEYVSPPSSAKLETRVPNETVGSGFKSPLLKGSSAPVISSNQTMTEIQAKKPSMAFRKPLSTHPLPSTETGIQTRSSTHTPSGSFAVMAAAPSKISPKRGVPKTPLHLTLGTTQIDNTGIRTPKNCPSAHEPLETPSSKSAPPGRKTQSNNSIATSPKPSFLGAHEAPSSQGNCLSPSPSSKSHSTPPGYQSTHEKGLKTRLPVGLKVLMKSPQLLRKSSTVPGKHEKDSLNEASKSSVAVSKANTKDFRRSSSPEGTGPERNDPSLSFQAQDGLTDRLPLETALPESPVSNLPGSEEKDVVENLSVKRSLSSHKPHLKPALGMNGAKARSQSFSTHSGDKPSASPLEGSGKVRTQIITNTAERGNSLTRQSSSTEGSPSKSPAAPTSDSFPVAGRSLGHTPCRPGPQACTSSSSNQHGSPSKLPLRILPKSEGFLTPPKTEELQTSSQYGPSVAVPEGPMSSHCRCPSTPADCLYAPPSAGKTQQAGNFETSRTSKTETSGRCPDTSTTRSGAVSPETPLSPTIEEKVMLCIQENVEKGQVQTKSSSVEAKAKPGPSFASWFGFRKSRLPALSSRKTDISKTKVEKKEAKGLGFANKQLKSERKKEKKKSELQCETDHELSRDMELADTPDSGFQSKCKLKTPHDIYNQVKLEPKTRSSPVTCSTKDTFMTELLNRVDKKAAQQTESGSNNVSCRSVLKGSSQAFCLTGSAVSTQGSHKKSIKIKADMEIPKDSLIKEAKENLQEDEEDTAADSLFQSHIIESNCQMRTLDSGIGTFPLPDSGNRSTGRYICQPDSPEDPEPTLSLQPALCRASSIRAQTLEREGPSSADSRGSEENVIVHSTSDPIMTTRVIRPPQSRLPKPTSSGKVASQKQPEAEPRPHACSSFEYAENAMASEPLPERGGDDRAAETQNKVPRMCAYSASGGSESESDPDFGNNGFGAGRGKLVKAMKSTIPEIETS